METSKRKKRSGLRMKRRTFAVIIISLCGIALIAEGFLLARTFKKKHKKTTPTPTVTQEATNVPSPLPTSPTKNIRHKLVKATTQGENGSTIEYKYDEYGRLKEFCHSDSGEYTRYTEYVYDKCGVRVITWQLPAGEEKSEDNYIRMDFWGAPFEKYENECHLLKEYNDPAFVITYDKNGYWKEVTGDENQRITFKFDEQGNLASYRLFCLKAGMAEPVDETRTFEFSVDGNDTKKGTGFGSIQNPGRRLNYDMVFENGKIVKYGVAMDGFAVEDSTWKYEAGGTMKHTLTYIDLENVIENETWSVPLPIPEETVPGESQCVSVSRTKQEGYEEQFLTDGKGRIIGISVAQSNSDVPPAEEIILDYDEDGRLRWFLDRGIERKLTYAPNGDLEKMDYYMEGDLLMTCVYEYADLAFEDYRYDYTFAGWGSGVTEIPENTFCALTWEQDK